MTSGVGPTDSRKVQSRPVNAKMAETNPNSGLGDWDDNRQRWRRKVVWRFSPGPSMRNCETNPGSGRGDCDGNDDRWGRRAVRRLSPGRSMRNCETNPGSGRGGCDGNDERWGQRAVRRFGSGRRCENDRTNGHDAGTALNPMIAIRSIFSICNALCKGGLLTLPDVPPSVCYLSGRHRQRRGPKPGEQRNPDPRIGRESASRHDDCQHQRGRGPAVRGKVNPGEVLIKVVIGNEPKFGFRTF